MGNRLFVPENIDQAEVDERLRRFIERCKNPQVQALREALEQSALQVRDRMGILSLPWDLIRASDTNKKSFPN